MGGAKIEIAGEFALEGSEESNTFTTRSEAIKSRAIHGRRYAHHAISDKTTK